MNFTKFSLAKKMVAGFGCLIMLSTIGTGFAVFKSSQMMTSIRDLQKTHMPMAFLGGELAQLLSRQQLATTKFLLYKEATYRERFETRAEAVDEALDRARTIIQSDEELVEAGWLKKIETLTLLHHEMSSASVEMMDAAEAGNPDLLSEKTDAQYEVAVKIRGAIIDFDEVNAEEGSHVADNALTEGNALQFIMIFLAGGIFIGGCALAFVIIRGITIPLKKAISGMTSGADQISTASGQVSSAGQQLADGATEQAAALEETSASMEEIASMTRRSADNAQEANEVMADLNGVANQATSSMQQLTSAMGEISAASEKTSKIIKTIDEIAFQTNLLALNAAVEAARAGEAGAGFAVVANEVRSLAMRAAEAARETAAMIEQTVIKVQEGTTLVSKTNDEFKIVFVGTNEVSSLIDEISNATKEQTDGVVQISTALHEMDKVVQNNADTAQQSAAASEELFSESTALLELVNELQVLIDGKDESGPVKKVSRQQSTDPHVKKAPKLPLLPQKQTPPRAISHPKKSSAKKAISFDEEKFEDF